MGNRTVINSIFFIILLLLVSTSSMCQEKYFVLSTAEIEEISEMMGHYEEKGLFSGVVLLAKDGKPFFEEAYGYSDKSRKKANTVNTEFNVASVGKLFTIVAVNQLIDSGQLDLDDTLGKYLHGFSQDISEGVTVRHLLTMTAGFGNFFTDEEYQEKPEDYKTVSDVVELIKKERLIYAPGTSERYSNSSFVLLGAIIEKVTAMDYFEYVEDNIFKPAGMTRTHFSDLDRIDNKALGYHRNYEGRYSQMEFALPSPAGGVFSSAGDLLKFSTMACDTNDLMSDESKASFYSGYDSNFKGDWDTLKPNLKYVFGWTGGADGISAVARHYIESTNNISFFILSNHTGMSVEVYRDITSILTKAPRREVRTPLSEKVYSALKSKDSDFVEAHFGEWVQDQTDEPGDAVLNQLGYELLKDQEISDAIAVFELALRLYPDNVNLHDSLGEAYMNSGQTGLAIKNYQRSLELDPQNANAQEMLSRIAQ